MQTNCENCPIRLFNNEHYNLHGVGNPYFGRVIIIPKVDYNAFKLKSLEYSKYVEIIKSVISPTGELQDVYIVPFIRCYVKDDSFINNDVLYKCLINFKNDIIKYNFNNILLLGDSIRYFLNTDIYSSIHKCFITKNNRRYFSNYSPFIKYNNDSLYNTFCEYLTKWYNNDYSFATCKFI